MSHFLRSIDTEKKTVEAMIMIFCSEQHDGRSLCSHCQEVLSYARLRLDKCPFGGGKPTCLKCRIHCYQPKMRDVMRQVMRYSGPKMLFRHPWLAAVHLYKEKFHCNPAVLHET